MPDNSQLSHDIATRAATAMVKEGDAAGLAWTDIAVSCETAVSIVVVAAAKMTGSPNPEAFAQEMIETITERAHSRVQALLRGVPYAG